MSNPNILKGVVEVVNGHRQLQKIYGKILNLLEEIPDNSAYKVNTKQIICYRLSVLDKFQEKKDVESVIGCGRFESLVAQAHAEYSLLQKMMICKPWEPLIREPPPGQWKWPCMA